MAIFHAFAYTRARENAAYSITSSARNKSKNQR
jgi:hypothetical protein